MLRYSLQIYFITMYCVSVPVSCVFSQDNGPTDEELFPKQKCESLLNTCSCYDLQMVVAIECNNMTDFRNFNQILVSGVVFDVNTTYEITLNNIKFLPSRTLKELKIMRLILDDPDMTLSENVFQEIIQLERFHVRQSSIKDIPDFKIVKDAIMKISIDSSRLTSLEGKNLQNLTLARRLSFSNNSIRFIDPEVFKGTDNVEILDLSHNLLTSIPPKLLDPMKKLKKFAASSNNLLHVNNLFSVTHPKFIYLDFNNITDANTVLQTNMYNVETFVLASNPIKKISMFSFNGKIPNVLFLYLDHCELREFNVSYFKSLSKLATLDLSYNFITEVTNQEVDLGYKLELDLIGNQIEIFDAEISPKLKRLYLSGNKLQSLNTTLHNTQMAEVQISRNLLEYLTDQDLKSVHSTTNLEFQENKIRRIDTNTFFPIRNDLHYLDLSYNFIESLNRSIRSLSQLKLLNLTHNLIQTFAKDEFTGLNELSELYLQHNQIKALGQLQYLEQLQYLVIIHNNIELITPDQIPKSLRFLYLADNPIKCDCRFEPFLLWLNRSDSPITDIDLCLYPDEMKSLHKKSVCPQMCICGCTNTGNIYFMSVDCSSNNLTAVPEFFRESMIKADDKLTTTTDYWHLFVVDQNIYPSLHIEDRVLGINLKNNNLESLEGVQLPPNLIQLYLTNNKLRKLPNSLFNNQLNLKQMSLSGNPWDCDCDSLKFKKWLTSKYDVVQDINNTRCGFSDTGEANVNGRIMWTLTDLDICPTNIGLIVSIAFGILILLLLASAAKRLHTKYEFNIKFFLYSHGFTCVKEDDLDKNKLHDAFLSFSNEDDKFVIKNIISEIENKDPSIDLYFHIRDFEPGETITNNIIKAVQNSKRTIVILSRNFLESHWCLKEFQEAYEQSRNDKIHRIIIIKVGDLPKEIDPIIKAYLDNTTYLEWGEKYFWDKLLYVLPNSNKDKKKYSTKCDR